MKKFAKIPLMIIIFLIANYFLYRLYTLKVNSFGCFDDCYNILSGYFMLRGRELYSEVFFNHQRLMADISYLIQKFFQPENIFELNLRHWQFVFLIGFLMDLIIVLKFKWAGLLFTLIFEISKFYLFGNRFLAESLIVYPLVYLTGLIFNQATGIKRSKFDYLAVPIFVWLVIFSREPFVPLSLLMFIIILTDSAFKKVKYLSVSIFILLFFITIIFMPIKDFWENVIIINNLSIFSAEVKSNDLFKKGLLTVFFYPLIILFNPQKNPFWQLFLGMDIIFLLNFAYLTLIKKYRLIFFFLLILGFANLRAISPGTVYYGAFHELPYYGIFIFITMLMILSTLKHKRVIGYLGLSITLIFLTSYLLNTNIFIYDGDHRHEELITNYGNYLETGEVLRILASPVDTLFLEGYDYLVYWQSGINSSYKYTFFVPVMTGYPKYLEAKKEMYEKYPPSFYYGPENPKLSQIPHAQKKQYIQLLKNNKPSRIYLFKNNALIISKEKWSIAGKWGYKLPAM